MKGIGRWQRFGDSPAGPQRPSRLLASSNETPAAKLNKRLQLISHFNDTELVGPCVP